jgi:chromosomal replication initiation ATPase DnaA
MAKELSSNDLCNILETMLESGLKALRSAKGTDGRLLANRKAAGKRTNLSLVSDVLREAGEPLYINEILDRVQKRYGVKLRRESVVSAMTKKVLDGHTFQRTGRNEFALLDTEEDN